MARPLIINDQLMVGGLQRDASGDSRYQSFRQLENFDIAYDPVALQRRKGWQYYGPTFSEIPQQVWSCKLRSHPDATTAKALTHYIFVKTRQYVYCFELDNPTTTLSRVYDGTGSNETDDWKDNHTPFAQVNFRVFFGSGTGIRWVDTDSITAQKSYPATMVEPSPLPTISKAIQYGVSDSRHAGTEADITLKPWKTNPAGTPPEGENDLIDLSIKSGTSLTLDTSFNLNRTKIAQQFNISTTNNALVNNVSFLLFRGGYEVGNFRVTLHEDSSQSPSTSIMKSISGAEAASSWKSVRDSIYKNTVTPESPKQLINFIIPITELKRNTEYWFILEVDSIYGGGPQDLKFRAVKDATYASSNQAMTYDPNSGVWTILTEHVCHMIIDGPVGNTLDVNNQVSSASAYSEYKFATRNVHIDESLLTQSVRTETGQGICSPKLIKATNMVGSGGDKFAIFRTDNPKGILYDPDTFNFIGTGDLGYDIIDCVKEMTGISYLNANSTLRSSLKDFDGNLVRPTHIIPYANRLFVVSDDRLLSFSERLEEQGSLGLVGDSLYFSFPAENKILYNKPITDFYLYNGTLYVFNEDGIDLVRGGDSPLNPPPDLLMDSVSSHQGTSATGCAIEVRGRLMLITSENIVKAFHGEVPMQTISGNIQSILDSSEFRAEKASRLGYDYYLGTSTGASTEYGDISNIYIFSLDEKKMFWRHYSYSVNLRHLHGTVNERLFATPSSGSTFQIIELETGLLDNTDNITSTVETHSVPSPNRSRWTKFELECSYPTATPPSMTVTATAKDGKTSTKLIQPTNSNDVRQHSGGLRILSEECKLKVETAGNQADEIRMITLK